jgi:hypothetical protein
LGLVACRVESICPPASAYALVAQQFNPFTTKPIPAKLMPSSETSSFIRFATLLRYGLLAGTASLAVNETLASVVLLLA